MELPGAADHVDAEVCAATAAQLIHLARRLAGTVAAGQGRGIDARILVNQATSMVRTIWPGDENGCQMRDSDYALVLYWSDGVMLPIPL